jgi:hypothetical protein
MKVEWARRVVDGARSARLDATPSGAGSRSADLDHSVQDARVMAFTERDGEQVAPGPEWETPSEM